MLLDVYKTSCAVNQIQRRASGMSHPSTLIVDLKYNDKNGIMCMGAYLGKRGFISSVLACYEIWTDG